MLVERESSEGTTGRLSKFPLHVGFGGYSFRTRQPGCGEQAVWLNRGCDNPLWAWNIITTASTVLPFGFRRDAGQVYQH